MNDGDTHARGGKSRCEAKDCVLAYGDNLAAKSERCFGAKPLPLSAADASFPKLAAMVGHLLPKLD